MIEYLPIIISGIIIFTALLWWLLALGSVQKDSRSSDVVPPEAVPAPPVAVVPPPAARLMDDPTPTAKTAPPKAQAPLKVAATKAAPTKSAKPASPAKAVKEAPAAKVSAKAPPELKVAPPATPTAAAAKPAAKAKAPIAKKTSVPDNLELLKGVGPKVNMLLKSMGITSFDQVANWTPADITEIDSKLGAFAGRIGRDNWVDQAKLLVAGDIAGFEKKYGALGSDVSKG